MKRIAFICELEEGHILPTFGLAHELKKRGHEVWYVSAPDNQVIIEEQGFRFYCMFDAVYPKGTKELFKRRNLQADGQLVREGNLRYRYHMESIIKEDVYGFLLRELKVDIVLISCYLHFDVMILYYKYGIRPVLLVPVLREAHQHFNNSLGEHFRNMNVYLKYLLSNFLSSLDPKIESIHQLMDPLNSLHEIILCPGELDFDNPVVSPYIHYVGPSLRGGDPGFNVYEKYDIPTTRRVVYSSMGSQAIRHGRNCDLFFRKVINIMEDKECSGLHLILCTGREYDRAQLDRIPCNVTLLGWGPQIDILSQSSVAIIHGGLGGIKECIYYGVPMIVFPQGYDQPQNAKRIVFHGLGFEGDIATITEDELKSLLLSALNSGDINRRIANMQKLFREKEARQIGAELIEQLMQD
jgi:zeaxanthin glucosyltransferase